ncbi:hypothetical protein CBX96_05945 [Shewanella sp. BC20]|uniref:DUF2987 domain-containing protein n=1 Tax=Shewanella sp. BC20 TaxID=2004459 RepID=UPI000D65CA47|nr:DUF2987 domain-containing protein [Shewanella sp. BC20]PWF64162.1 hypothetical protein CBX96_05945 [Shewanella sp. BC20]
MYKKWWLVGLCLCATSLQAETISLEYKGFYDRLKQVNKGNYQLVEIAFSVPMLPNCQIQSGSISSELNSTPLTYTAAQRLFIPFDDALKDQRALVNLEFEGKAEGCGIAMQVRAKQTLVTYDKARLAQIASEMDALLGAMQGFPMRYFKEPIAGLNFEFAQDQAVSVTLDGREQQVNSSFKLSVEQLNSLTSLQFSQTPTVLSPWVK